MKCVSFDWTVSFFAPLFPWLHCVQLNCVRDGRTRSEVDWQDQQAAANAISSTECLTGNIQMNLPLSLSMIYDLWSTICNLWSVICDLWSMINSTTASFKTSSRYRLVGSFLFASWFSSSRWKNKKPFSCHPKGVVSRLVPSNSYGYC